MVRSFFFTCVLGFASCSLYEAAGIILIYEVEKDRDLSAEKLPVETVLAAVQRRVRTLGEASVDKDGRIEIRVYGDDATAVRKRLNHVGVLEFRIVADRRDRRHREAIALAEVQEAKRRKTRADKQVRADDYIVLDKASAVAKWAKVVEGEKNNFAGAPQSVLRDAGDGLQVLVILDRLNVSSEHFQSARASTDRAGRPCVSVTFKEAGARRFGKLTGENLPHPTNPDICSKLAVIVDGKILTAPTIRSRIDDRAEITGSFSVAETEELAAVLSAGSLPAPLRFVDERPAADAP